MAVSWTEEQQKVIDTRDCNILVSAAAGSGKTAVLVERILERILDKNRPVDIDRLLVVTFTRAAAGEMKERIARAIEKRLEEDSENEHLQRQSTLVHHAQITTIDSFCAYVVKNYFHLIDLDPSFRMGDEGEMRLMKGDVGEKILEEAYGREDYEEFSSFVEGFAQGKSDENIEDLVLKLYEFSMSYPYPREWLEECRRAYQVKSREELENAPWMEAIKGELRKQMEEAGELLSQALEIAGEGDGPGFYIPLLEEEKKSVEHLLSMEKFFQWKEAMDHLEFKRLPPGKKAEKEQVTEEKQELAKNLRSQAKDLLNDLKEKYFQESAEESLEHLQAAARPVGVLVDLTLAFMEVYKKKKQEKNILDFSDLEHYALEILADHSPGKDVRTQAARELADQFAEIMIDEYQDSNLVQEKILTSVSRVEEGEYNIFMVGDVKQSIYRFRLARPDLFMEKFRSYPTTPGDKTYRIDLHKNFRSRGTVLDSVNYLFYQIMGEDLGGVEYDEDAALYPKGQFPQLPQGTEPAAEVLLLEEDDPLWQEQDSPETARELEARMIAMRIRELMDTGQVTDKDTGELRKVKYSDITILLRTMSGWSETFKKILNSCNIPASVTTKTGYFSAPEVAAVLDYLQILDNPFQDIPLAGALKNQPQGFTFEELARIRNIGNAGERTSLYEALLETEKIREPLGEKVGEFLKTYRELRQEVPYTPIHQLIWDFFDKTGFLLWQQAFVSGEQRKANLLMLLEKARDYESTSYRGLFNFVRYIENLKKYQVDFGEANILSEKEDTVKIMSIHGSKGLEFPVVFVAGLGKQMNMQDARESIVLHPDLGIGAPCVDEKLRIRTRTILQRAIQQEITLESLGEELRILYVALTRAREKLILTGTVTKLPERLSQQEMLKRRSQRRLPYGVRVKGKSYLGWILSALARHRSMKGLYQSGNLGVYPLNPLYEGPGDFKIRKVSPMELVMGELNARTRELEEKEVYLHWDTEKVYDPDTRKELEESLAYVYPYEDLGRIPAKVTVSEVKRLQEEVEESLELYPAVRESRETAGETGELFREIQESAGETQETTAELSPSHENDLAQEAPEEGYVPAFMRQEQEELKGAERGTAYHAVLERLDYEKTNSVKEVQGQIRELCLQGKISEAVKSSVRPKDIYDFASGSLGQRMKKAAAGGLLKREQPFVIAVPASSVKEDYRSEEEILVQGIIDACFEEEGDLVLVDYKTDRIPSGDPRELTDRYKIQLLYYQEALELMTGKKVKEKYIYSFYLKKAIPV